MNLAAIILAAGASSRFEGGHKLLAEIGGVPMIRRVTAEISKMDVTDIVIVTGANGNDIRAALGEGRWRVVANTSAADGLASSLRVGLEAIDPNVDGALVMLGDLPGIDAALMDCLIDAFDTTGRNHIVFPRAADGRHGHPVIWPRALFPELKALSGDSGGRALLDTNRDLWQPVETHHPGAFTDIDTRADLDAFARAERESD